MEMIEHTQSYHKYHNYEKAWKIYAVNRVISLRTETNTWQKTEKYWWIYYSLGIIRTCIAMSLSNHWTNWYVRNYKRFLISLPQMIR